jgi:hypothetical protein
MTGLPQSLVPSLISLVIIALVVRRSLTARKLNMDRMLLLPGVLVLVSLYLFASDPPRDPLTWSLFAAALAVGGVIGWHRGKLTIISHDAETGELTAKPSVAAVILILMVFAARFGLRFWLASQPGAGHNHIAVVATNALLLSTVGVIGIQRVEMYVRCRRLIAAAA